MIKIIDNFISDDLLIDNFFETYINRGKILYSLTNIGSQDNPIIHSFNSGLDNKDYTVPLVYDIYKKLCANIDKEKILRWHANIYPTGYDGTIHTDNNEQGNTYLYCCAPHWDINWGGEFIVYDHNMEAQRAITFKKDRMIVFNGSLPHRAVAPTRLSTLLRCTIAFQTLHKDESEH